jgi:hypothetical protein
MSFRKLSLLVVAIAASALTILTSNTVRIDGVQAATPAASQASIAIHFPPPDDSPILSPGAKGQWDAVSVRFPQVVLYKGTYYLFYGTFQTMIAPVAIGYATSSDGLHWTKFAQNPVLSGSGAGFDAFGVTRPVVMVQPDGTWVMYYDGIPAPNNVFGTGIGRATAPSPGGPWIRNATPVLETGSQGEWDAHFLFPDSIVMDGNQYVMYYSAGFMVGRATSADGIHWTKYNDPTTAGNFTESDPVLQLGLSGSWDSALAWGSSVQHTQNGWEMFYYGGNDLNGGPGVKIGYAYSADGITWTKYQNNPVIGLDIQEAFFPSFIINPDGTYSVYFAVTAGSAFTEFHVTTGTITRGGA